MLIASVNLIKLVKQSVIFAVSCFSSESRFHLDWIRSCSPVEKKYVLAILVGVVSGIVENIGGEDTWFRLIW